MTLSGGGAGGTVDVLRIDIEANTSGVDRALNEVEGKSERVAGGMASRIGGAVSTGLKVAGGVAIAGLAAIGTAAFAAGTEVESAMGTIRAGTGATGKALADLKEDFKAVAADADEPLGEVAQVLADLNTRTGQTGEGLRSLTGTMLDLAGVAGDDVNALVASTTRLFGDWGIATDKQEASLDLLWKTSQTTGIGVGALSEKLVAFGAPLRQFGFSIEESAALLGKFEKEGVNTDLVMGSLRQAMGKFAKENIPLRKGLDDTIASIIKMGPGAGATAKAMEIFGARAGPDMAAAILEGKFSIDDLIKTIGGSTETIAKASEDSKTLGDRFGEIKNAATIALEPLGTLMLKGIAPLIPHIKTGVQVFGELVSSFMTSPRVTGVMQAALESVQRVFQVLKPIVLGVIRDVRSNFETMAPIFRRVAAQIEPVLMALVPIFVNAFKLISAVWNNVLKPVFIALAPFFEDVFGVAARVVTVFLSVVSNVFEALTRLFSGDIKGALKSLEMAFGMLSRTIETAVMGAYNVAVKWIERLGPRLLELGSQAIQGLVNGIKSKIGGVVDAAKGAAQGIIDGVKNVLNIQSPSRVMETLGAFTGEGFIKGIESKRGALKDKAKQIAGDFAAALKTFTAEYKSGDVTGAAYVKTLEGVVDRLRAQRAKTEEGSKAYDAYSAKIAQVSGLIDGASNKLEKLTAKTKDSNDELARNKAALEQSIAFDKFTQSLDKASVARLKQIQTEARATGDAQKYGAATGELRDRTQEATAAAERHRAEIEASRKAITDWQGSIRRGEALDAYAQGIRSASRAQLDNAAKTAFSRGEQEKYSVILAEVARREDLKRTATEKATQAAKENAAKIKEQADRLREWQNSVRAEGALERYTVGLRSATDAQLVNAQKVAFARGEVDKYNAIIREQERREEARKTSLERSTKAQEDAAKAVRDFQASVKRNQALDVFADALKRIEDTDLQAKLQAAFTVGDADRYALILREIEAREVSRAKAAEEALKTLEKGYRDSAAAAVKAAEERGAAEKEASDAVLEDLNRTSLERAQAFFDARTLRAQVEEGFSVMSSPEFWTDYTETGRIAFRALWEASSNDLMKELLAIATRIREGLAAEMGPLGSGVLDNGPGLGTTTTDATLEPGDPETDLADKVQADLDRVKALFYAEVEGMVTDANNPLREGLLQALEALTDPTNELMTTLGTEGRQALREGFDAAAGEGLLASVFTPEELEGYLARLVAAGQGNSDLAAKIRGAMMESAAVTDVAVEEMVPALEKVEDTTKEVRKEVEKPMEARFSILGIETGLSQLEALKTALKGVGDVITNVFKGLVTGAGDTAGTVVEQMQMMALGIVEQVAVAIAAYQLQALAMAILQSANPLTWAFAAASFVAAAAIAGIAAGMRSNIQTGINNRNQTRADDRKRQEEEGRLRDDQRAGGGKDREPWQTPEGWNMEEEATGLSSINLPNAAVTVTAAPEWSFMMLSAAQEFSSAVRTLVDEGIRVRSDVKVQTSSGIDPWNF